MNDRLNGAYGRLEMPQARVTPAEVILIIRDMHNRLQQLEGTNEKQEDSKHRRGSSKLPEEKIPTH